LYCLIFVQWLITFLSHFSMSLFSLISLCWVSACFRLISAVFLDLIVSPLLFCAVCNPHFQSFQVIDARVKGNLGRFINHSCDPNCRTEKVIHFDTCLTSFLFFDLMRFIFYTWLHLLWFTWCTFNMRCWAKMKPFISSISYALFHHDWVVESAA